MIKITKKEEKEEKKMTIKDEQNGEKTIYPLKNKEWKELKKMIKRYQKRREKMIKENDNKKMKRHRKNYIPSKNKKNYDDETIQKFEKIKWKELQKYEQIKRKLH